MTDDVREKACLVSGPLPAMLQNDVSDAIHKALTKGMEVDEAVCLIATVIADYARNEYGDEYLDDLAAVLLARGSEPLPEITHD